MNPQTRAERPGPRRYLPTAGLTRAQRAVEQDTAAGDREGRILTREDGSAVLGSVALRCYPASRRVYAYLRWSSGARRTAERYIGDVSDCPDRATALRDAWARVPGLINPEGRPVPPTAEPTAQRTAQPIG